MISIDKTSTFLEFVDKLFQDAEKYHASPHKVTFSFDVYSGYFAGAPIMHPLLLSFLDLIGLQKVETQQQSHRFGIFSHVSGLSTA
jgi:hypothetical protein